MAENFGKGSGDLGYDRIAREEARPPAAARRDPRADPDDDGPAAPVSVAGRVDVVLDRPSRSSSGPPVAGDDPLTNAALVLRRELAKLHQQAAAVERTIEDQRRERSDALERIDFANQRANDLQGKLDRAEADATSAHRLHEEALAELEAMRRERDDIAREAEAARTAFADLARLRAETETLRKAHEESRSAAAKFEAELAEIRKREQAGAQKVSDVEGELASLRERVERTTAELGQSRDEAGQLRIEAARLRAEANDAHDSGARAREEADRDRTTLKEQLDRAARELAEARAAAEKLTPLEADLATARRETTEARNDVARLERELEDARRARDVAVERATMAEKEAEGARQDTARLGRELTEAHAATARAEARALQADRARATTDEGVRQLRDEVTSAFARWRSLVPSVHPTAASAPPPTRAVPLSQGRAVQGSEAPPATRRGGIESEVPAPPASLREDAVELEEGWSSSPPPATAGDALAIPGPPPAPNLGRSVPPPAPPAALSPPAASPRSVPPPVPGRSVPPPPPRRPTIPPAVYSVPPPAGLGPPTAPPAPPTEQTRRDEPSSVAFLSKERDELLERLGDAETAREAASLLREHPEWLTGRPPIELLAALTMLDYDVEAPIFELARTWEREAMCRAVVGALRDEPDPKLREHGAWLLKHLGSPSALPAMVDLVTNEDEPPAVRRWLLEAIERLVANRSIGWRDIGDLVTGLLRHGDATLRDGVVGVLAALERSDDKRRLLLEILRTDDDEMVLASAVHALGSALPIELDPAVSERLLGHPSPRVQRSVVDFIERSKRAQKA